MNQSDVMWSNHRVCRLINYCWNYSAVWELYILWRSGLASPIRVSYHHALDLAGLWFITVFFFKVSLLFTPIFYLHQKSPLISSTWAGMFTPIRPICIVYGGSLYVGHFRSWMTFCSRGSCQCRCFTSGWRSTSSCCKRFSFSAVKDRSYDSSR